MENRIALYPITSIAQGWDDEPFDRSILPVQIVPSVTIEEAKPLFKGDQFDWLTSYLGKENVETLKAMRFSLAIVYRYHPCEYDGGRGGEADQEAEMLVRNVAGCLRLIRPMAQTVGFMRGTVREDSTVNEDHFENPTAFVNVPCVQKLFSLRNRDVLRLQSAAPKFLDAMTGEFWKFRMAVELHEAGHHASHTNWKARFSLWCSAIEALFTSNTPGHKGSLVAKERIKWFLGSKTPIYAPGDIPSIAEQSNLAVEDIIEDLYELRNSVAHGDKTGDKFFKDKRICLDQTVNLVEVLHEATSFILRASLLKMLEDNLLPHFANGPASNSYFGSHGLTGSVLRKKKHRYR
jgi:hypothetical protein